METQDHKNPITSGHDGHGGNHVCHKCGWPYPNPHPSSKNRRAHKKVCGTIEKYRLDNDAQGGCDAEPHSDDELDTPKGKDVERTISRRSSSGVGSRSDRSARSEDELFTDAVTEFNENPAIVRQASGGVIQRFYSMQNENELDDSKPAVENHIGGADILGETDLLMDDQLQTFPSVEVEKDKVKVGNASQDHSSTNISLASAAVMSEIENSVDHKILHTSEPADELDIVSGKGKESISIKDEPELKPLYTEIPKGVADDLCGFEDNNERLNVVDSSERDKIENRNEVDSPGNFSSPALQGDAVNPGDGNVTKSELVGGCDPEIGFNANVDNLAIPNSLPLEQHPEIEVEDLYHIRGKNNSTEAPDSSAKAVEHGDIVLTKCTDSSRLSSEDNRVCSSEDKWEEDKQSVDEQKTFGETNHIYDANLVNADVGTKEKKHISIFPEGATMVTGKATLNSNTKRSNIEDDGEYFTVVDNGGTKVSEDDLAVTNSAFIKPTVDDATLQDIEHLHICDDMGNDANIMVESAALNRNETSDGSVVENVSATLGSYDAFNDSKGPDRTTGYSKMDRILDSGDLMVGHSQGESLFISPFVEEIESSDKNVRKEERVVDNGTGATLKTDKPNSMSKVDVDKDAENTCCITEGDRESKQQVTVSTIDSNVDAGSLDHSLDGNWGSGSIVSTISDAVPTADTIGSNHPQSLEGEENLSVIPNPVIENQQSQHQGSPMPEVGIEQIEHAPTAEICSSKQQQNLNMQSSLQTASTPTVAHVANEANRGNKGKEIMTDTANWDSEKQNTPLKTLLGEATARSRAESPIHHNQTSTSTSVPQRDVIPKLDNGNLDKTENAIINPEMGKEWNSPARYPVKIKTEKKSSKSKPYWAPFLCCSSVNAR